MNDLRLVLLTLGVLLVVAIWLWSLYARRRRDPRRARSRRAGPAGAASGKRAVPPRARSGEARAGPELDAEDRGRGSGVPPLGLDFPEAGDGAGARGHAPRRSVPHPADTGDEDARRGATGRGPGSPFSAGRQEVGRRRRVPLADGMPPSSAPYPDLGSRPGARAASGLEGLRATRDEPGQLDIDSFNAATGPLPAGEDDDREVVPRDDEPEAETLVVILTLLAPEGERLEGARIRAALEAQGLRYGKDRIFHHYPSAAPASAGPLFSAVNIVEPGVFDLETIDSIRTPGLGLFMRLPGPKDPGDAFATMVETARALASELDAQLCDETRSKLTAQALNHLREQIADFGRRRLLRV